MESVLRSDESTLHLLCVQTHCQKLNRKLNFIVHNHSFSCFFRHSFFFLLFSFVQSSPYFYKTKQETKNGKPSAVLNGDGGGAEPARQSSSAEEGTSASQHRREAPFPRAAAARRAALRLQRGSSGRPGRDECGCAGS